MRAITAHRTMSSSMRSMNRVPCRVILPALAALLLAVPALGGERVVNGGFGSNSNWTNWTERGSATRNFNSSSAPSGGSAPCLQINGGSNFNGGVFQAISLVSGQTYTLSAKTRDVNSSGACVWAEILVGTTAPAISGSDYGNGLKMKWDTWACND